MGICHSSDKGRAQTHKCATECSELVADSDGTRASTSDNETERGEPSRTDEHKIHFIGIASKDHKEKSPNSRFHCQLRHYRSCLYTWNSPQLGYVTFLGYDTMFCDEEPTRANLVKAFEKLSETCKDGDTFVFVYLGHGGGGGNHGQCISLDKGKGGEKLESDYVYDKDLIDYITRSVTKGTNIVAFTDCCHSGGLLDAKGDGHFASVDGHIVNCSKCKWQGFKCVWFASCDVDKSQHDGPLSRMIWNTIYDFDVSTTGYVKQEQYSCKDVWQHMNDRGWVELSKKQLHGKGGHVHMTATDGTDPAQIMFPLWTHGPHKDEKEFEEFFDKGHCYGLHKWLWN